MLKIQDKSNYSLVLGNHIISGIGDEGNYSSFLNMNDNILSIDMLNNTGRFNKPEQSHFQKVLENMRDNPDKWGGDEDWIAALKDTSYNHRVVESCARQYKELAYLLVLAYKGLIHSIDVWYMIYRLEISYKEFISIKRGAGLELANKYLEYDATYQLTSGERGFAKIDEPIGIDYLIKRIDIGGSPIIIEHDDNVIKRIQESRMRSLTAKSRLFRFIKAIPNMFNNSQLNKSDTVTFSNNSHGIDLKELSNISYEEIIVTLQQEQALRN